MNFYLPDDELVLCPDNDRFSVFKNLIREKFGRDAELEFEYMKETMQDDLDYSRELEAEKIADGYLEMCRDAMETFEQLIKILKSNKRLNRDELLNLATEGYKNLYNGV